MAEAHAHLALMKFISITRLGIAADSAHHNNNSALPTKLLELSSWDFLLHSNSFSFASGTTP